MSNPEMQSNTKKEVSCKTLEPFFNSLNINKLDENILLQGVPYSLDYLKNKYERIEWSVYCTIVSNLRPYFTLSEFEEMGARFVQRGVYIEGILIAFFLFSTNKIAKILRTTVYKLGDSMFSCVSNKTDYLNNDKIRITFYLRDGYKFLPEFYSITKGTLQQLADQSGRKGTKINVRLDPPIAVFEIKWYREGFLFSIRRGINWVLNFRKALVELTESHVELRTQYDKLEESKNLLQKQTTQLKTTHNISTSIRQSLNIKDTLEAITNALVAEAGFSFAFIKLIEDADEKEIDIKSQAGTVTNSITPIHQEVIINKKKIGELIVYPKIGMDYHENIELLEYLSPILNIAIHDALVLRAIVDYRDNLETKVANRTLELQNAQDELVEINKLLKEAHQTQSRFFTNISHEFRTPLTLILGPVKQIIEKISDTKIKDQLGLVQKNANSLLGLVNQLLDISKLESGKMKLKAIPMNFIPLLKALVMSFASFAERKNITLRFKSIEDEIIVYIDKDKIEKIIVNILSNAFKFTPEGGRIEVSVICHPEPVLPSGMLVSGSQSYIDSSSQNKIPIPIKSGRNDNFIEISISDTGIGIPKEKIPFVFDRFYQVDGSHKREHEGTGIGLSLTKELIELHHGKIEIESMEGKGTTFIVSIPLGNEHLTPEEICDAPEAEAIVADSKPKTIFIGESKEELFADKKSFSDLDNEKEETILIVEDNTDVRNYIKNNLENDYRVLEAIDGEDGWNNSVQNLPDIIVSDVMMPKMDGFTLLEKLKTDERTSHIPVIMLTAKATSQDKIEGYQTGADAYIMKPFDSNELKVRIKNLIQQRKRIQQHFQKIGIFDLDKPAVTSVDKKFLRKTFDTINHNLSDTSFSVESLAENIAVSRYVLYKKIVSLTGESPVELIRRIRLQRAAELIEKKFGNLSEIALEVGFNNPAYFSDCFKKQFGVPPSQYHQKITSK